MMARAGAQEAVQQLPGAGAGGGEGECAASRRALQLAAAHGRVEVELHAKRELEERTAAPLHESRWHM
jgi:glycerate kinase